MEQQSQTEIFAEFYIKLSILLSSVNHSAKQLRTDMCASPKIKYKD